VLTHWPRTPVHLRGQRYDLCWSLGAVAEAQQQLDVRGIEANMLDGLPELTLASLRIFFPSTLRKYHPGLDRDAAWRLVTWQAIYSVAAALKAAWRAAAPVSDKESKSRRHAKPHTKKKDDGLTRDQQWQRLWSLAVYDLRLSTEQFYSLTVGQLDALLRRREREIQEAEFMPAQLTACVVNFSMARPKESLSAKDFMPSAWRNEVVAKKPRRRKRQLIAAEIQATMEHFMKGQNAQARETGKLSQA
jgi:hypothetical protein